KPLKTKPCHLLKGREVQPSDGAMNPRQVFLSVLVFGVAGLLLFMYLQVWIEEQHPGRRESSQSSPRPSK
ncbi:carbohydrate sulfotransferase 9-like, partial [Ornithorhynchus anatinus]|uniref:carbohydrate sulfotransferase 9-like n=1 Tax=Ornithorhynchus anatinus TaxID=9258 RepID=UPI0019D49511